jgi:hypothetical protein
MKMLKRTLVLVGVTLLLSGTTRDVGAQERQGRGNFDPEQMRVRMMERYREQLEVKSDDEWKVLESRITKVSDARREMGGFGGFGRGGGRRGGGGDDQAGANRPRFGPEPSAEGEALQKAIEAKASADEIKSKLAKYRESQKQKEAKLAQAQDELKKVLSVRQEATAVLMGLLP